MNKHNNANLHKAEEIDRTKIEGYSLRIGAFYSWLKKSGYTTKQIAKRIEMDEDELKRKLKEKEIFNKEQLSVLIKIMGATSACFVIYFPTFELRKQVYLEVFGRELPLQENRGAWKEK